MLSPLQSDCRDKNQVEGARWVSETSWHFPVERDLVPGRDGNHEEKREGLRFSLEMGLSGAHVCWDVEVRNVEMYQLTRFRILS